MFSSMLCIYVNLQQTSITKFSDTITRDSINPNRMVHKIIVFLFSRFNLHSKFLFDQRTAKCLWVRMHDYCNIQGLTLVLALMKPPVECMRLQMLTMRQFLNQAFFFNIFWFIILIHWGLPWASLIGPSLMRSGM